jgi:hypothetical protein
MNYFLIVQGQPYDRFQNITHIFIPQDFLSLDLEPIQNLQFFQYVLT